MIVAVRDISNNYLRAKEVAATLACFASNIGHNTVTLQLGAMTADSVENVMYREHITGIRGTGYGSYAEEGIDSLLSMATMSKISKDAFADSVRSYLKTKKCDVAAATRRSNFMALLPDKATEIATILQSASEAYDYVFVTLDSPSFDEAFEFNAEEIKSLIELTIWTTRQGRNAKLEKHETNEIFVLTDYDPRSSYTTKIMRGILEAGKKPVLGLCKPVEYRDAIDSGRLVSFVRRFKSANELVGEGLCLWAMSVRGILDHFVVPVKNEPDVWELLPEDREVQIGYPGPAAS